jgi:hypothetical protein
MTPEQAQKLREFEESVTMMVDHFPRIWRKLYENCIQEGFIELQAMELVKTFILKPS